MDPIAAERIGRNDSAFRDANEQISVKAKEQRPSVDQLIPFLCECADEDCTTIIPLSLVEYEGVRSDSRQFLNVFGHERAEGLVEIVFTNHNHLVVRKAGRAGEIAQALNPRRDEDGVA